ncbi:hypothetical protein NQ176_g11261 [Zarea fungicola]|uniref:Uncharacterized protein n=1 Tax=Zarea fungicola TaxID=93591 RepID=A0ACC1MDB1_9HYPO|nr:hypothetical protein NQ176_g11261 [Lecanicillium fungicola]
MGRVRTKTVKKSAKVIIERYYPRLTLDFETNKRICDEIAIIASKRLRNKIAGYTTHLMKRIQRGPVRGISFKLQEEERERKDQYVPEISALDPSHNEGGLLQVDGETKDLLKHLGFDTLPVNVVAVAQSQGPERASATVAVKRFLDFLQHNTKKGNEKRETIRWEYHTFIHFWGSSLTLPSGQYAVRKHRCLAM